MTELLPCPFCSDPPSTKRWDVGHKKAMRIWCDDCSVNSCVQGVDEIAIEKWNTRPIEEHLRAEVDRLTKERDEARKECRDYRNRLVAHLYCIQRINSIPTEYHLPWENKTDE